VRRFVASIGALEDPEAADLLQQGSHGGMLLKSPHSRRELEVFITHLD
jgi:hypothetical protein